MNAQPRISLFFPYTTLFRSIIMPQKVKISEGARFGRWTVMYESAIKKTNRPAYFCVCDCGTQRDVQGLGLRNGTSKSCGCLKSEKLSKRETEHGLSKHFMYWVWHKMIARCDNVKIKNY